MGKFEKLTAKGRIQKSLKKVLLDKSFLEKQHNQIEEKNHLEGGKG